MKQSMFIRMTALALSTFMAVSLLAGCGGKPNGANTNKTTVTTAEEKTTEISIMTVTTAAEIIDNTNLIWQEIEKKTNTKLKITFVPQSNYAEKFNVSLASGSLMDVNYADNPQAINLMTAAINGAFWEIGKYYKDYKELAKYNNIVWENSKASDGKNYALPRPRASNGGNGFISFRQDWLDKLKLKLPETSDEIYNVLKAFVNDDPDGNGQKDTQGLVMIPSSDGATLFGFHSIFGAFAGYNLGQHYFTSKDGTLKFALNTPELKDGIMFLRKLYSEGLLHKDFATMKQQQMRDAAMSGKLGATGEGLPGSWVTTEGLKKVVPNGDFTPLTYIKTPKGDKYNVDGKGYNGAYVINKQNVNEAKMKNILGFFDKTSSLEIWELANYGIKDTHYTKDGVVYKQLDKAKTDKVGSVFMGQIASMDEKYFYAYNAPNSPKERVEANIKRIDEIAKVAVENPIEGVIADSWDSISKEYNKKITDQILKIVLGAEKIESWEPFVAKLMADPKIQQAEKDMAAAYKLKKGK